MKDERQLLKQELLDAGASTAELKELFPLVSKLSLLRNDNAVVERDSMMPSRLLRIIKPASFMASGLALGVFIVIISQAVLPTSFLYPVQKFSDDIAVSLHPQYRANIMMKRAQQVNELVANHADSKQVLATLADYTQKANTYKSTPNANYAAFEYCKTNLQQAESAASPEVRQTIVSSLRSLETT